MSQPSSDSSREKPTESSAPGSDSTPRVSSPPASQSRPSRQPRARLAPEYEILLERLIAARHEAGITQGQVAQALGKTQSHVSMCENREREISMIDLWKWCRVLGLRLSDFIREFERSVESR